jgi:NTP pyrophosphatase (non-canonical NTP hydrolase)
MRLVQAEKVIQTVVNDFAGDLTAMLIANGKELGWRGMSQRWLIQRLREEVEELERALDQHEIKGLRKECLDVAAFAMMIRDGTFLQ